MIPSDKIEKAIKQLSDHTTADMDKRTLADVYSAMDESKSRSCSDRAAWRIIMQNRLTKFAVAAVIIFVTTLGLNLLSDSTGSELYAATIKALENVKTVHISGWTTRVRPRYSTSSDKKLDESKQYQVDEWQWVDKSGKWCNYSKQGPITTWENNERCYEYQENHDRLYIKKGAKVRSISDRFKFIADRLETLKERKSKITELPTRMINGNKAKGFRVERSNKRTVFWIDTETDLMLESSSYYLKEGQWVQWRHGSLTYDRKVPNEILAYTPPRDGNIEYSWDIAPRFEKWNLHLQGIAAHYQDHPLPETMELLPRKNNEEFDAYSPGRLPGITDTTGYWVTPISSTLGDYLLRFRPSGSLRVPSDIKNIQLNHDLVTHNKHTQRQRIDFVLDSLGFEIVETTENRKVWIANWNGQALKPWQKVKAPVPNPDHSALQAGMSSGSNPESMKNLFDSFVYYQGYDLHAKGIVIIDQTNIRSEPKPNERSSDVAVSSNSIYWGGKKAPEIARKWFKDEFGVTFKEEIRAMTVYVVQSKRDNQ